MCPNSCCLVQLQQDTQYILVQQLMWFIMANQTLSTQANSDPRREYVESANSVCVQETVKQWLMCKQPDDNSNKKYAFLLMRLSKFSGTCAFYCWKFHWHGLSWSTAETCHRLLEVLVTSALITGKQKMIAALLPLPLHSPWYTSLKSQMTALLSAAEDQILPELLFWKSNNSFLTLHSQDL